MSLYAPPNTHSTSATPENNAPVARFFKQVVEQALKCAASDIHFEPFKKFYRIRLRVDGLLQESPAPPAHLWEKLASYIKLIAALDISEKRIPQDGRIQFLLNQQTIDLRISTLPTLFGEKIVLRLLQGKTPLLNLAQLGYEPEQKEQIEQALARTFGLILVTGPTGSGKTISLYSCLQKINRIGLNISSVEDPVEIDFPGINQINLNEKAGLNFASALRAFLRQDPDVIMVGEIRDLETADIAIKAAHTGHLVLSTLHTQDAPSALTRFSHMGITPFHIASSISLITAQRLIRCLCSACKKPLDNTVSTVKILLEQAGFNTPLLKQLNSEWHIYQAVGCPECHGLGYQGRTGIYQVMPLSDNLRALILKQASSEQLTQEAQKQRIYTLREAGLLKIKRGQTSIEEIITNT